MVLYRSTLPFFRIPDNGQHVIHQRHQPPIDAFRQLSLTSQKRLRNISSMGFPLDRVSRIADKFGTDDKKVNFSRFIKDFN